MTLGGIKPFPPSSTFDRRQRDFLGHAGENGTLDGGIVGTTPPAVTASDFERFLDIALGKGGITVSTVEAYFNDSGSHPTSPVVCVAGYIFDKEQAIKFDREWRAVLNIYHLPFFRMSSFAHGSEPFDDLSPHERATLESNLIAVINKWMSFGVAITVEPETLTRVLPGGGDSAESPFSYCARFVLTGARRWIDEKKVAGDCAYIFESGHRSHEEANDIMNRMYLNAQAAKSPSLFVPHFYRQEPCDPAAGGRCAGVVLVRRSPQQNAR